MSHLNRWCLNPRRDLQQPCVTLGWRRSDPRIFGPNECDIYADFGNVSSIESCTDRSRRECSRPKRPMQTFMDAMTMTKEKMIAA